MKPRRKDQPPTDPRLDRLQMLQALNGMQQSPSDIFGILGGLTNIQGEQQRMSQDAQMAPERLKRATLENSQMEQLMPYLVQAARSQELQRLFENQMTTSRDKRENAAEGRAADLHPSAKRMARMGPKIARSEMRSRDEQTRGNKMQHDVFEVLGQTTAELGNKLTKEKIKESKANRQLNESLFGPSGSSGGGASAAAGGAGAGATDHVARLQAIANDPKTPPAAKAALERQIADAKAGKVPQTAEQRGTGLNYMNTSQFPPMLRKAARLLPNISWVTSAEPSTNYWSDIWNWVMDQQPNPEAKAGYETLFNFLMGNGSGPAPIPNDTSFKKRLQDQMLLQH